MTNEDKPMTDEELAAIQGRLTKATPGPWVHSQHGCYVILGYKPEKKRIDGYGADDHVCVLDDGDHHQYRSEDEQLANAALIAHAPDDISRLLAEVERLREEKEILEGTLDRLGIFVQENLNYCAADFIGEGIDEDAEFTCKTEYDPDNGCQKCYSNCWADVFRKTAEEEINALKELEKENAE